MKLLCPKCGAEADIIVETAFAGQFGGRCPRPDCDVVFFRDDGAQLTLKDLKQTSK